MSDPGSREDTNRRRAFSTDQRVGLTTSGPSLGTFTYATCGVLVQITAQETKEVHNSGTEVRLLLAVTRKCALTELE